MQKRPRTWYSPPPPVTLTILPLKLQMALRSLLLSWQQTLFQDWYSLIFMNHTFKIKRGFLCRIKLSSPNHKTIVQSTFMSVFEYRDLLCCHAAPSTLCMERYTDYLYSYAADLPGYLTSPLSLKSSSYSTRSSNYLTLDIPYVCTNKPQCIFIV